MAIDWDRIDEEIVNFLDRESEGRFSFTSGANMDDFQLVFEFGKMIKEHWVHESMMAIGGSFDTPEKALLYVEEVKQRRNSIEGKWKDTEPPLLTSGNVERD